MTVETQRREVKSIAVFSAMGKVPQRYEWRENEGNYAPEFDENCLGYQFDDESPSPLWEYIRWIAEAYVPGSYEGDGTAVIAWTDGRFSRSSLAHCSCYSAYRDLEDREANLHLSMLSREELNDWLASTDNETEDHKVALRRAVARAFLDFPPQ